MNSNFIFSQLQTGKLPIFFLFIAIYFYIFKHWWICAYVRAWREQRTISVVGTLLVHQTWQDLVASTSTRGTILTTHKYLCYIPSSCWRLLICFWINNKHFKCVKNDHLKPALPVVRVHSFLKKNLSIQEAEERCSADKNSGQHLGLVSQYPHGIVPWLGCPPLAEGALESLMVPK